MTDTPVAPPEAAPSATPSAPSAPSASEVRIDTNRVDIPAPIGPQTPQRDSARESLLRAFERAQRPPPRTDRPAEKPVPKAAEAKAGHNQPPEQTPPEKLDLKKRPGDQPQPRGDRGQFAPRVNSEVRPDAANSGQDAKGTIGTQPENSDRTLPGQTEYKRLPPHAPYAEPPGRFSEAGKRDWADASENIRGDVYRMAREYQGAYEQYRSAAEAFKPVAHFHRMAQEHGTTLQQALNSYVTIEQKLREDPVAGLDAIINNLGLTDPATKQKIGLRDIAYHVLSQSPEQLKQVQYGNSQQAAKQQIGALYQEVNGLKNALYQMHNQQQFNHTRSALDQFAESHPRLDELGELIKNEIGLGFDLDTAYRRAELLHPATHAAQTRTAPAQTRTTDRSIHGNPGVAPSDGAPRRPKEASRSPRDAVQNAMKRLNGAF